MKKTKLFLLIGLSVFILTAFAGCGSKTTVNLNKYVTITAQGYNSMGTADYEFDYEAFKKDCAGKIKINDKYVDPNGEEEFLYLEINLNGTPQTALLDMCIDQNLDNYSGLSNGDTVTLKWDCNDELAENLFNVRLDHSDITYTVKELKEVGTVNPFDYLTVELDGVSPNGSISLKPNYDKPEIQYVQFSTDKSSGLKNGDTVKITASIQGSENSFAENFGVALNPTEQEYTVERLPSYVTSASQINSEVLTQMVDQGRDVFMTYTTTWWDGYVLKSVDYVGNYLLALKEGHSGDNNYLYLIYHISYIEIDGIEYDFYYTVRFRNLKTDGNGICTVDLVDYEKPSDVYVYADGKYRVDGYGSVDSMYERLVLPKVEHYTFEKNITA